MTVFRVSTMLYPCVCTCICMHACTCMCVRASAFPYFKHTHTHTHNTPDAAPLMQVYSAHDTTIFPLLCYMDAFDGRYVCAL